MFTLSATVAIDITPNSLAYVSFWDESQTCGVSFSCHVEKPNERIEVMVSDQSNYYPEDFTVELSRTFLRLSLPPGTVRPDEGGDEFEVRFNVSDAKYLELEHALTHLLVGRGRFRVIDGAAAARPNTSPERTREE
jgi:hypothetical protein